MNAFSRRGSNTSDAGDVNAHLKRNIGHPAVHGVDHSQPIVTHQLNQIQYDRSLIDSLGAQTDLTPPSAPDSPERTGPS